MARKSSAWDPMSTGAVVLGYLVLGGALVWSLFYRTPAENGNG
jgi:hypothetical protein